MVKIVIPKVLLSIPRQDVTNNSKYSSIRATMFNYTEAHILHMLKYAPKIFDHLLFQSERCPSTGNMHLQFYGLLKEQRTVHWLQANYFVNNACILRADKPSWNILYASKKDSHEGDVRHVYNISHIDIKYKNRTHQFLWDLTDSEDTRTAYLAQMDRSHKSRSKGQGTRSDLNDLYAFIKECKSLAHAQRRSIERDDLEMLRMLDKHQSLVSTYYNHKPRDKKPWPHKEQYLWQSKLISLLESDPDDRTLIFIVDFRGRSGKTTVSDYLLRNYNAFSAFGKEAEVYYLYSGETIILCDSPRDRNDYINYSTLEKLKDGTVTSTKYQPVKKYRDEQAHIVVFMNQWPDIKALSRDRYNIYCIDPVTKDMERVKHLDINHKSNIKHYNQTIEDAFSEDDESYEDEVTYIN